MLYVAMTVLCASAPLVEVVEPGPVAPVHGQALISSDTYEVVLGALVDVEMGAGAETTSTRIARARLRIDAQIDTVVPAGLRLELDASPFADSHDRRHGPGILRDAYLSVGVGNKAILNLGELRVGQMLVPTTAQSMRAPEHWRFSQAPLLEQRVLPGRDIGFLYHIDYAAHGLPLQAWVGSFGGTGPNGLDEDLSPLLSLRLEYEPLWSRRGVQHVRSGLALLVDSFKPESPAIAIADLVLDWGRLHTETSVFFTANQFDVQKLRTALRAELGLEVLTDFFELRLRHETSMISSIHPEHRLSVATLFTYLDDAFQVLADVTMPMNPHYEVDSIQMTVMLRMWL